VSLKILWITSDFPLSLNANRNLYLWHPLEALQKIGVESIVLNTQTWKPFFTKSIDLEQFPVEIKNVRYLSIPRHYMRSFSNFSYIKTIVPVIKKLHQLHQFDIIHAHGEICGLAAVNASKKLNIPAVVTIHGIDMCPRAWKSNSGKMFRKMLGEANKIIYVGEPLQKHFSNIMKNNQHSCVIHNGFQLPTGSMTKKSFEKNKSIRIISVSNLHEGKGIDLTIQALALLKNQGIENWSYTIIGDGDQKKYLEKLVNQLRLDNQVIFKGNCPHDKVYANLEKSDIFCLPSYREAFGIAYVEAMAHGLLTIGVKGQGAQAFIRDYKTGFLVRPQDINNLKMVLQVIITQCDNMREIASAGKEYVLSHFTWEKHAEKLLSAYHGKSVI